MAKREKATAPIRVYPSTRRVLNRLAGKHNMTIAKLVQILSRFGLNQ